MPVSHFTLEHIDPRHGKLVSGLKNSFNERIVDFSYNARKTNRFVPYRVCNHSAPEFFGDTGEFLINGEWVVCEFGGPLWWEESNKIGCSQTSPKPGRKSNFIEYHEKLKTDPLLRDKHKEMVIKNGYLHGSKGGKRGGAVTGKYFWWTNGTNVTRSPFCPGEGWRRGRK
jgi:hypothetical protein